MVEWSLMTLLHFKPVCEPSELSHSHEHSWMMLIMCVQETSTLGIDLSQDWTNASLAVVSTLKPSDVPALDFQSLWWDQEQRRALLFCGGVTFPFSGGANSRPSQRPSGRLHQTEMEAVPGMRFLVLLHRNPSHLISFAPLKEHQQAMAVTLIT